MVRRLALSAAVLALAALVAVVPFVGCTPAGTNQPFGTGSGVKVAVSFPALYSLAANVVGDTGTVRSVKSTQGAHGSEVTRDELDVINAADILFVNGLGLDNEFAKKLRASSSNPTIQVVALGDIMGKKKHSLLLHSDGPCVEGEEEHEHDGHDPHVWMGLPQVIFFVDTIAKELGDKYPHHKETFFANAEKYKDKLKAIKAEGDEALANTPRENRKIVTVHGSMGYFAHTFKIEVVDTIQKAAGKEPTQKQLDDLLAKCKKENVRVIASEPQFSKLGGVKTLAEELKRVGVTPTVIELDNLEAATADALSAEWYEVKMRANIAALKEAFK